jgi:ABC-2 type transport system ATP-binding protein
MGFVIPSTGHIKIFGHEAGSLAARDHIGYLPEVALYYPFLTPMETLWLYGTLQGIGRKELKAQSLDLLERVGLKGFEKKQLKTFSKGMQQRLGIAQALLGAPKILVLDEVTSGIDPLGRRQLRELLHEVKQGGTTIFFSSHELDEVAQLCDRVLLVNGGRLIEERIMDETLRSGIGSALEDYFVTTMERASLQKAA